MTTYHLRTASPAKTRSDVVVVGAIASGQSGQDLRLADGGEDVAEAFGRRLRPLLSTLGFTGKAGEVAKVPTAGVLSSPLLVIVGLGEAPGTVALRRAAGTAARAISNASSVALALPADSPERVRAVIDGYDLGSYTFTTYKRSGKDTPRGAVTVSLLTPIARQQAAITAMEEALIVAQAVRDTRDWVNLPAADLRPPEFADAVVAASKKLGRGVPVTTRTYDEKELADLGCGGILGVGSGSAAAPRMVELTYAPDAPVAHLALVGKGITYDSGGLSIKTASGMTTMKCDMAGAAAVVQATFAIARLGTAGQGLHVRPDGREHGVRHGDASRRRDHPVRRDHRGGPQHRRRGAADPRRRAGPGDRAGARRDPRRGDPHRAHRDRAR